MKTDTLTNEAKVGHISVAATLLQAALDEMHLPAKGSAAQYTVKAIHRLKLSGTMLPACLALMDHSRTGRVHSMEVAEALRAILKNRP